MGPTIQRGIAIAVAEVAASQGADRAALLALLGPDLDAERVPIERLYAMWELAMRSTRCVALPVRVAAAARFDRYGALGMAIYVSRSMKVAIHRLCQYSELLTDSGHWRSRVEGDDLVITWAREGERTLGHRAANEHALASLATVGRQLYPATTIREVRLRHHLPAGLGEHERHFGAPVIGGASEDAVVFPLSYVSQQPPGADPHVERFILPNHRLIGHEGGSQLPGHQKRSACHLPGPVELQQCRDQPDRRLRQPGHLRVGVV